MLLVFEGHLGARKLAEEHAVSLLDIELLEPAVIAGLSLADGDNSPSCGFSLAVSVMMMPPVDVSSSLMRSTMM